jgi:hypothetical protein
VDALSPQPPRTRDELLAAADRLVAGLSPAKRETAREVVIDAVHRGHLPQRSRAFLDSATGSPLVGDVLTAMLGERGAEPLGPASP